LPHEVQRCIPLVAIPPLAVELQLIESRFSKKLLLLSSKELNINEIAERLNLPQSTVATNVSILEKAGLVETKVISAKKGKQKICKTAYKEILIQFLPEKEVSDNTLEVEMPIGLYTNFKVSAPCGLCSPTGIIGFLDVPDSFLNPERMGAGLLWFETGWVEYQFPNNSLYQKKPLRLLEMSLELSSETPGTKTGSRISRFGSTMWKSVHGHLRVISATNVGSSLLNGGNWKVLSTDY